MSRPLRLEYPGSFWHVTQRGNEQRDIFLDDHDRRRMLTLLGDTVRRVGWQLYTYTLMTNHYHLALELTRERTLSRGMHWLDGKYVQYFNRRYARVGHLFQGRYKAQLVDKEEYFLTALRYIALNPVRAGIVASPGDYEWSSYRATAGLSPAPPWLAIDRVLSCFGPEPGVACAEYRKFVEAGIGDPTRPWDNVVGQIYLGSEEWMKRIREQVKSRPRSDEFPDAQRNPSRPTMEAILRAVSSALATTEEVIRHGRGGIARMLAAWLAWHEGGLELRAIADTLGLRSASGVSKLVSRCDSDLKLDQSLRERLDQCLAELHSP